MIKAIFVVSAALTLATPGLSPAFAQASDAPSTKLGVAAKTSDRTPDNPSPSRTPGASLTGAAGHRSRPDAIRYVGSNPQKSLSAAHKLKSFWLRGHFHRLGQTGTGAPMPVPVASTVRR